MATGFVVSDLHLLARRSCARQHQAELERAMERADVFILNGDTFDFRWSMLRSVIDSIEAAIVWLRDLVERFPRCHIHFVLGNHDGLPAFVQSLLELAATAENLSVHRHYFCWGDKLFVHGDAAHAKGDPERLARYRAKFDHVTVRGEGYQLLYTSVVFLRLHAVWPRLLPRGRLAKSLIDYFQSVAPELLPEVRHIYFGHTHAPFSDFIYQDWLFHNTGAMIHGTKFQILKLELA